MASGLKAGDRLLLLATALLAVLIACRRMIFGFLRYDNYKFTGISPYNIAVLTPSYFDNGFIRRGLGGSIVYLIEGGSTTHPPSTVAVYHLLGAIFLVLPLVLLLSRMARRDDRLWRWLALFTVLSPQLFWGWSRDPGRSDMFICGIIAWSVIAALDGRFIVAALLLFVGSLMHETAVIYGGPMLVALWYLKFRQGKATPAHGVGAITVLVALLALTAIAQMFTGDDVIAIATTVREGRLFVGNARLFDIATYLTWGGFASIETSWCMGFADRVSPYVVAACFVVLFMNFRVLTDRSLLVKCLFGLVALIPMIFMSVVAIDNGRWLMFAVANAWLAVVAMRVLAVQPVQQGQRERRISAALFAALVLMGPASVDFPSYAVEKLAPRVWPHDQPKWLEDCTPGWQATLGPPEGAPQH